MDRLTYMRHVLLATLEPYTYLNWLPEDQWQVFQDSLPEACGCGTPLYWWNDTGTCDPCLQGILPPDEHPDNWLFTS